MAVRTQEPDYLNPSSTAHYQCDLGQGVQPSRSWFLHLQNGDNNSTYCIGFVVRIKPINV